MQFDKIQETTVPKIEKKSKELKGYSRPTLFKLGSVADLTTGTSGSQCDATSPTSGTDRC